MKLTDVEQLLANTNEMDIDVWDIPLETIKEIENLYMVEPLYSERINNHWITINSGNVTLTLNTMKKTKGEYKLPELNINF